MKTTNWLLTAIFIAIASAVPPGNAVMGATPKLKFKRHGDGDGPTYPFSSARALPPISGVIGDDSNPTVALALPNWAIPFRASSLRVSTSDARVLPAANVSAVQIDPGKLAVALVPTGVGFARVLLTLSDQVHTESYRIDYAASAMGRPGGHWHLGASDASTAVAVDGQFMFIGDDESQTLRLYRRDRSGLPVRQFDMNGYLGLTDLHRSGRPKEIDIEASLHVGKRIYWLGSQSHDFLGQPALNRGRIFATDIVGSGMNARLTFAGRYDFLTRDLIRWDADNQHGLGRNHFGVAASLAPGVLSKAESGGGFAIEGLCASPDDPQAALLGFRAPLITPDNRRLALIVPVTNFLTLAVSGAPSGSTRFGSPLIWNLDGRGIRAIKGSGTNYLIVAGPPGHSMTNHASNFRLFTWDGRASSAPVERDADLRGLNPEGIVALPPPPWTPDSAVNLVSDNGLAIYYGDKVPAKNLHTSAFKKSRSDWVKLGAVLPRVTPSPGPQ